MLFSGVHTYYFMPEPPVCPRCKAMVTEKTLVEWGFQRLLQGKQMFPPIIPFKRLLNGGLVRMSSFMPHSRQFPAVPLSGDKIRPDFERDFAYL
jgi:hypothetical protein